MKRLLAPLRGTAAVMSAVLLITGTVAHSAPKKPAPAPAPAAQPAAVAIPAPAPAKKGLFSRTKDLLTFKKKEKPAAVPQPAPVAVPSKVVSKTKAAAAPVASPAPVTAKKTTPAKSSVVKESKPAETVASTTPPPKKRWLKGLFSKSKPETSAEPQLAKARTARPAPVKEVKLIKPAAALVTAEEAAPREKRGLFGLIRRLREPVADEPDFSTVDAGKIERPADWQEHKTVTDDDVAIYSFGPMQSTGPDRRLERGTVVKVRSVRRGWALVEVDGGFAGYMDSSALRDAAEGDFKDPPPPTMIASAGSGSSPDYWAPLAPPPDLPDQPSKMDSDAALLLLPPLELEPKPNP
jgi:hypothetical protein